MSHHELTEVDFGTGKKKLSIYVAGLIACVLLTLLAFWVVIEKPFEKSVIFAIVYTAAFIQFLVQLICFLRLNLQTRQGQTNVMSFLFVLVILITIVIGSVWIMAELMHNTM